MEENGSTEKRTHFSWLTTEIALYGLILALALALRLGGLGDRLLDVPEAEHALLSWRLVNGDPLDGAYSPLLLFAQSLLFGLFGASDAAVRLLPALFGGVMVIAPYFVRARLGRLGALAASLALAVSPSLIYSARYGDGGTLLAAYMLGVIALWLAYERDRRSGYLYAIAVLVALGLLSDPRVVGVLIVLALAWAVERFLFGRNVLTVDGGGQIPWMALVITGGVTLLLVGTAFLFNPFGIAAWANFPSFWAARLAPVVNGQPWYYPLSIFFFYEPLLLVFGALGAVDLLVRKDKAALLNWLALGLLVLALVSGGRNAGDVALYCVPLALLAGRALDNLANSWIEEARLEREGLFGGVALVLLVYVVFETILYARAQYIFLPEPQLQQILLLWLLAVVLIVILVGLFWVWFGPSATWRAAGGTMAVVLILVSFSAAVGLNFRHAADPREPHVRFASDEGLRDALRVMADLSYRRRGYPNAIAVTVDAGLGPIWPWYLRDWEDVTLVDALSAEVRTDLVVASREDPLLSLGDNYTGQDFVVRTWWETGRLHANDQLTWWLYRKSRTGPEPLQGVILWARAEAQVAGGE